MRFITLLSLVFLTVGAISARAEDAPAQSAPVPTHMTDEQLASYITGRLAPLLKASGYKVSQNCGKNGCDVIVQ